MALAVEVAGKTDVGCVRANNEDNFGFDLRYGIFVVCDGMGGQEAGEVASKMGVDILLEYFRQERGLGLDQPQGGEEGTTTSAGVRSMSKAIQLANATIFQAGQSQGRAGMGSTIVAALVRGNALTIGHVGDSRIYLVRQGAIQQLTQDHSLVMERVRRGYITLEQARQSVEQNIILRALGPEEAVEADVEGLVALPGDFILMTSDGLIRHVADDEVLQMIIQAAGPQEACASLVEAAKERGGEDNITCLLLKVVDRPWYREIYRNMFMGGPKWQNSI